MIGGYGETNGLRGRLRAPWGSHSTWRYRRDTGEMHGRYMGDTGEMHPLGEPLDAAHGVGLGHGPTDVHHQAEREADEADLCTRSREM